MKPLKIIIFDGSFKTTPFINRLVKGLTETHHVYILGFNEKLSKKIKGVHYVSLGSNQNKLKFTLTTLKLLFQSSSYKRFFATLKLLIYGKRQLLKQQNLYLALTSISPDIIHIQWPSTIQWFEETLLQQKIPVLVSQRGFHSNVRPFVDATNFQYLRQWYPKIAGFHSVSKAISANGDKIWNSPNKIDKVVYTGLDINKIHYTENYKVLAPLQILSVGRAHWIKGYDYALQCCKILKDRDIPFLYTIIGGSGNEELQFLVNDLGLQNHVILEKKIPQTKVFKVMSEASLLLMPSLEEGLPNVIVEAMAIGLPVISTDCGGVSELITHTKEGWLVPTRNSAAMALAIENFKQLPFPEIENVRSAARKKVEQQHNEAQMIAGVEQLYKEVLALNCGEEKHAS
ncbi:glycosyltransferase family 4 protein [Aequorivita sp. Q41]|uniref:glycosyltransferase family 4 protein n=1 Tax=Aequorivita sp. Q41 TaxID=3153300 RepID=UPI003241CE71